MTAVPVWIDTVLPQAMARFHAERPGVRLILDTARAPRDCAVSPTGTATCTAAASTTANSCPRRCAASALST